MAEHKFLELMSEFLETLASPLTRAGYQSLFRSLDAFLKPLSGKERSSQLVSFVRSLERRHCAPQYVRNQLHRLNRFYSFLEESKFRADNPVRLDWVAKVRDNRSPKCLTLKELTRVAEGFDPVTFAGRRDSAIFACLFYEGLRSMECAALSIEDIDLTAKPPQALVKGKLHRLDHIDLDPRTVRCLRRYIVKLPNKTRGPLFVAECDKTRRLDVRSIRKVVKKHFAKAGVRDCLSTHALRHSLSRALIEQNVPVTTVARRLRHSDPVHTLRFYYSNETSLHNNASRKERSLIQLGLQ